jgi:ParB family chromosome partitioning protein
MTTTKTKKIEGKLNALDLKSRKTDFKKVFSMQQQGTSGLENALLIDIAMIEPNPAQPRRHFIEESLKELAESIKERGVLQPIRVRPRDGKYQIIAGERRWQAARAAGILEMPCIVSRQDDRETYIDALMENIHREDLNPIDRANALSELRVNLGLQSWETVGKKLGLTRQHIYNLLGLKHLPGKVQEDIKSGVLTEKHGRALKPLLNDKPKFEKAYRTLKKEKMSGDDALNYAKNLKRSDMPENQKAFTSMETANNKYKDLLLRTPYRKFNPTQKKAAHKSLAEIKEILTKTLAQLLDDSL